LGGKKEEMGKNRGRRIFVAPGEKGREGESWSTILLCGMNLSRGLHGGRAKEKERRGGKKKE